jgi:chemotaxis protein MotB
MATARAAHGTRRRRSTGHAEEAHDNHERWLLTYADVITLLMALFIVMYAISQLDTRKFEQLAAGMSQSFTQSIMQGGPSILVAADARNLMPSDPRSPVTIRPPLPGAPAGSSDRPLTPEEMRERAAAAQEQADLAFAERRLREALEERGLADRVRFAIDARGLTVTIITNDIVFRADDARLQPGGALIVDTIAPTLVDLATTLGYAIAVEGHTNTVPVAPRNFASEWELSSARASVVVRRLVADGVPAHRLTATGYADQRPLLPDTDPRSTEVNRRVDVVVLSHLNHVGGI